MHLMNISRSLLPKPSTMTLTCRIPLPNLLYYLVLHEQSLKVSQQHKIMLQKVHLRRKLHMQQNLLLIILRLILNKMMFFLPWPLRSLLQSPFYSRVQISTIRYRNQSLKFFISRVLCQFIFKINVVKIMGGLANINSD